MLDLFRPLEALTLLLLTSYKGTVAILMVAVAVALFGRSLGPRARYALWLLVLIRLAVPFTIPSDWSVFNLLEWRPALRIMTPVHLVPPAHTLHTSTGPITLRAVPPVLAPVWRAALMIWVAGAALLLLRAVIASRLLQRRVRAAARAQGSSGEPEAMLASAVRELGIRRRVGLVISDAVRTPALHGLLRPTLLLPAAVVNRFEAAELRHIILHELWHLRRNDVAVNWLLVVVQAVHWFNPLVWFAAARVREERELCCDELALSCLEEDERSDYGTTILKLLEGFRTAQRIPALVGIVNPKQQMKRRLTMIASFKSSKRLPVMFAGVLGVVAITAFTDGANAGEKHEVMIKRMVDPAAHATMEKMHQRVSLNLTNVSFNELLSAVSASNGVVITQSPAIATDRVQQARFTIDAKDVPAHMVLMHTLMPFKLMPKPDANGVSIESGSGPIHVRHSEGGHAEPAAADGTKTRRIVIREGSKDTVEHDIVLHRSAEGTAGAPGEKKLVMVRTEGHGPREFDADGKLQGEFVIKLEENGVASEGKLKFAIEAPVQQ